MNKGILKRICIVFLTFILFFNSCNIIYAAGAITEEDNIDDSVSNTDSDDEDHSQDIPITNTENTYTISGKVWEDKKNISDEYGVLKGDGIYQEEDEDKLVGGITVNLINENSEIIKTATTNSNGFYSFSDIETGNYKVQFVYGKNKENLKYNGQDYKSSIYYKLNSSGSSSGNSSSNEKRDILFVIDLSGSMKNYISDLKSSLYSVCETLLQDNDTRISICTYSSNILQSISFTNNLNEISSNVINKFEELCYQDGQTNTYGGLSVGYNYLINSSREDATKSLILFTDGEPNCNNNYNFMEVLEILPGGQLTIQAECRNYWNSINVNKLAICFGGSPTFETIFGESGDFTLITDKSNLSDSFQSSVKNFTTSSGNLYATDSPERRLEVMNYSMNINYANGSILNIDNSSNINEFMEKTYMTAETPMFYFYNGGTVSEVNLALEERPRASVEISKNVSHLTITLSDGNTLIDWTPNQNVKNLMVIPGTSLTAIMDDEITHGATIKIQYEIKLKNTSENDNLSNYFTSDFIQSIDTTNNKEFKKLLEYYKTDNLQYIMNEIIPTKYYIYDYLDNNSIFDAKNSPDYWSIVYETLPISDNINLDSQTILEIQQLNDKYFLPNDEFTIPLKLSTSKLMTIADTDLLTYNNYVEVVQYNNVLGRRVYNVTPGNLDIYDANHELEKDEAKAETVTRVPPFGKDLSYYTTIVGIIILAIEIAVLSTLKIKIKHLKNRYIRK